MNNQTTLYICLIIPDDYVSAEYNRDHLYLDLDNGSGLVDLKWKTLEFETPLSWNLQPIVNDGYKFSNNSIERIDYQDGGTTDGLCSRTHSNPVPGGQGNYTYEFMIPFQSQTKDQCDLNARPGDNLSIKIQFAERKADIDFFNFWETNIETKITYDSNIIYIRNDGSIDPPIAPISTLNGINFQLNSDINKSILVEKDGIILDGLSHKITGIGESGIALSGRINVVIKNFEIRGFTQGISVGSSIGCKIAGNTLTGNYLRGIILNFSSNNYIMPMVTSSIKLQYRLWESF
jgi:parallel beta-helix repeat protein